jgi:predicted dehydrogenase
MSAKVFHIPLVLTTPSFHLAAIVQRKPIPTNSAAADHPSTKLYNSYPDLLADTSIDIVIVTSTPETHYEMCAAALRAGKHVMVEKPFVPTSAEADSLVKLSKETGKLLCVYQNRRWDSDFLTFRKLQQEGTLGRIVEFESHFDRYKAERPSTWKGELGMDKAGGVIYDLGTHLIDQAVVAFGLPKSVTAFFANQRGDQGEAQPDSVTVLLHYDGLLATIKAGVMSITPRQLRYFVRGTKGTYLKHHLDCQEDQLKAGQKPGDPGFGVEVAANAGTLSTIENGQMVEKTYPNIQPLTYGTLYEQFARAVEAGDEELVPVKAEEARDVLRVIEAARRSAEEGKTVVL